MNLRLYSKLQLALELLRGFNWGHTIMQNNRAHMVLELVLVVELVQMLEVGTGSGTALEQ